MRLSRTGRRSALSAAVCALAVLLLPVSGKCRVSTAPSSTRLHAAIVPPPESLPEKMRLLEERYSVLKRECSKRTGELAETLDRLAESMARLGKMRDRNEECSANLSVARRDHDACAADRYAVREELGRCTMAAKALETEMPSSPLRLVDLEAASRHPPPDNGLKDTRIAQLETDLQDQRTRVASRDEEIALLKKELDGARSRVRDEQSAVASRDEKIARLKNELDRARSQVKDKLAAVALLEDETDNQAEMVKSLMRKASEGASRLEALQRQMLELEDELNSLRGRLWN